MRPNFFPFCDSLSHSGNSNVGETMSEVQTPWINDVLGMSLTPAGVSKGYEHTVSGTCCENTLRVGA